MKVAVIGAGYWGKKHIEEYQALGHEISVYDSNPDAYPDISTYKSILTDKSITAVSICTPNHTHYKIAVDMLDAGKNVLVEKPISMSTHEAVDLIATSKIHKLILSVGHLYRFNNAINEVKHMLHELGNIRSIKFTWTNTEPKYSNRDIIYDLAPHPFDIINYLLSKNPTILSCVGKGYRTPELEIAYITGVVDGTLISIELSWITPPKTRTMTIVGSEKTVLVDCVSQAVTVYFLGETYRLNISPNNTIRDELQSFIGCINDGSLPNIADGMTGLNTLKAIEQCYRVKP